MSIMYKMELMCDFCETTFPACTANNLYELDPVPMTSSSGVTDAPPTGCEGKHLCKKCVGSFKGFIRLLGGQWEESGRENMPVLLQFTFPALYHRY